MQMKFSNRNQLGIRIALAVFCSLTVTGIVQAQVASALLQEDSPLPGMPTESIDSLSNTAVNNAGGFAVTINTSGSGNTLRRIWGNATPGVGSVLRTEGTIGDDTQTSFEGFFGIADSGSLCYAVTETNNVTMVTGLDSVYLDNVPLIQEGDALAIFGGELSTFNSRPGISGNGVPYWVAGFTSGFMGGTANRSLVSGNPPMPLLTGGDLIPGFVDPVSMTSFDFDWRLSEGGSRYIGLANLTTGSSLNDGLVVLSDNAVSVGGLPLNENSPVAAAAGGLQGELWDNFDFFGINESGDYLVTGDTTAASGEDEFVLVNDVIVLREGAVLPEGTVDGSIEGGYLNSSGDWAVIWDIDTPSGNVEALILNGDVLLLEGEAVDWNNDGVIDGLDNNGVVANFTGISALTVGARDMNGNVDIYFTADIDFNGTSSTTDDLEGYFRLTVAPPVVCLKGDANLDGSINTLDIPDFVNDLLTGSGACESDINDDGATDGRDIFEFGNCVIGGGC